MEDLGKIVQNIKTHTAVSSDMIDEQICDRCGGIGFIFREVDGYTYSEKCECRIADEQRNLFKISGISEEQSGFTIKSFKAWNEHTKKARELAIEYLSTFQELDGIGFGMMGGSGTGKTHITCAIANELLRRGIPVKYMAYRDVITSIKQNMLDDALYKKEINKYKNVRILLIDDLFKGKISASDINIMFEIINHRILHKKPILFSTELRIDHLMEIDEAIGGRLVEQCERFIVQIKKDMKNNYRLRHLTGAD